MADWYFLIFFLVIPSCLVAGQTSTFGLKGEEASLKPDITGQPDGILWKFKGNKVTEFDGKEQHVYSPYENRITLDWVTAELTISHLRLEDSGEYKLIMKINNKLHTTYYALKVMDKVSRPTISCKMKEGGSVISSGELVCSAEPQPSLKFEWGASGKLQVGPKLQIPLGEEHDDEVYSCSVSNLLSKETTTFTAKDCYPEESSSVAAITIAVIIIALVLLLVCVAIFWLKRHNKACFAEDDLEKQSSPGSQEGSNKKEAQNDEKRNLVHRESTLPSDQKLFQGYKSRNTFSDKQNEGTDSDQEEPKMIKLEEMQNKGHVENAKKKVLGSKGDADAVRPTETPQENVPLINQSDSVEEKDPEPAGVSDHVSEDKESSPEGPKSPEHPEPKMIKQEEMPNEAHVKRVKKRLGLEDDHHEGDADAVRPTETPQEKVPLINQSDSVEEKDPEPAGVMDHVSEDKESSPEGPKSTDHPEPLKEAEAQSTDVEASPADQELSPSTKSSLNMDPKDQKDVTNSGDADAVRPTETPQENVPLINQSDSVEEKNPEPAGGSDHVSEDKESSPEGPKSPEHPEPSMIKQEETPNKGHVKSMKKRLGLEDDHHEGDADAVRPTETPQEKVPLINQSDSVEEKDPEPAGVMDHVSEDKESSPEGPKSTDHPEPLKEPEAQSTDVEASPADQELSPLTQSPLNMDPKDQKDVTNSGDADAVRPTETPQEKVPLINQSDSVEEKNPEPAGGSDHVSEDKESSPEGPKSPEHPGLGTTIKPSMTKQEETQNKSDCKTSFTIHLTEPPQEKVPLINQSDSVEKKNPEPAGVMDHVSEDKESSPEGSKSTDHTGLGTTIKPKMIKQEEMPNEDDHHEGDADAVRPTETPQEKVPLINQSDSVEKKNPEPAGVMDHVSEDKESSPEGPKSPEHPEPLKEAEAQSTDVEASLADQELSPSTKSSLNMDPKDQKDVTNSGDADAVRPTETPQEKVPLINQSDSVEEKDPEPAGGSDHVSEDKESSPEGSKSTDHPEPLKEAEAQSTDVEASPADQGFSPLTQSPLNMGPKDQKDVTNSGDADAVRPTETPQEKVPLINQSDSVEEKDPEPAGVMDHVSEDKESSPEGPKSTDHTGLGTTISELHYNTNWEK
ncbi:titin-like [Pungitius pungitius]|uniref:titin-like n=1 Tax=Pungitius pungitius TaxID=134920 RepID=UPI002E14C5B2